MTLREKIEQAIDCIEVDSSPGHGGWIDSQSKKEAVDAIEIILKEEIENCKAKNNY